MKNKAKGIKLEYAKDIWIAQAYIRFYTQCDIDTLVEDIKKIDDAVNEIRPEFIYLFYKFTNKEPYIFFNKSVSSNTYERLMELYSNNRECIDVIHENLIEKFFLGYNAYEEMTKVIEELREINESEDIKNRLYRIPTYVSLVEGCLANLYRSIIGIVDMTVDNDLSKQNKLGPLNDLLNKYGFSTLTKDVDIDIRNAINHGGVLIDSGEKKIQFSYYKSGTPKIKELKIEEMDALIEKVYDTASGIILGIIRFVNNYSYLIKVKASGYIKNEIVKLQLSVPSIYCNYIAEAKNAKQLNMDFTVENYDRTYLIQTAIEIAMMIYEKYPSYEKYFIGFRGIRLQTSWVRFINKEIKDIIYRNKEIVEVCSEVVKRKDIIIFDPRTEEVDVNAIKYHRYPNFDMGVYKIRKIADASTYGLKRFRAQLFVQNMERTEEIMTAIQGAIEKIKVLENPPCLTMENKHGDMEADCVYLHVFRHNTREKNKYISTMNDNFICVVEYAIKNQFVLKEGGLTPSIWRRLIHDNKGNIKVSWNPRFIR